MTLKVSLSGLAAIMLICCTAAADGETGTPPTVVVDTVKRVKEAAPKRYVGSIEPIKHVDIMPRVTGTLQKIHFTEGAMVEAGTLLYELEDTTYRAAVDALRAQREQLQASLKYADSEFRRNSTLLKSNAVAVATYDKAQMEIDAAQANLKQIEASLLDAENTLSYTKIYAPISGRIGKSAFTEGNLITPQGGKLTDIEMIAPIHVRFSLSERVFRRDFGGMEGIRDRAVIRLELADGTLYGESAGVSLIDNKINASTNTITVWAAFQNHDKQLIPGGFVTVLASAKAEKEFLAVLPSALIAEGDGFCVYALDNKNRVIRKTVQTGGVALGGLQIILEGLDGSERIIVDGTHKTRPGSTVTPVAVETVK